MKLALFKKNLLVTLELFVTALKLNNLGLSALLNLFKKLLVLGLKLDNLQRVSVLELLLAFAGIFSQSVQSSLEVSLGIFTVLLCSVSLLLEELELSFP